MYIHTHTYTQLSNTCRYIYAPDEVNLLLADLQSLCNYCRCSGRGRRTVWYSATTKFRLHSVCVAYVIYWLTVWESTPYVWRVMYWLDVWGKDRMHLFPILLLWRGGRGLAEMTFTRWSTCSMSKDWMHIIESRARDCSATWAFFSNSGVQKETQLGLGPPGPPWRSTAVNAIGHQYPPLSFYNSPHPTLSLTRGSHPPTGLRWYYVLSILTQWTTSLPSHLPTWSGQGKGSGTFINTTWGE